MGKRKNAARVLARRAQSSLGLLPQDDGLEIVDENIEKAVVDWVSAPDPSIAARYNLLRRPAWINPSGEETGCCMCKDPKERVPVDRGTLPTDEKGWLETGGAVEYPLLATTDDDLGAIGGVGMRLYYYVLRSLAMLFLLFGLVSIPALRAYDRGDMYSHPAASRFADVMGAKQVRRYTNRAGRALAS
jgi:hypothetical protein